jgi:tetratricopeptide (TPR) repeat protein
MMAIFNRGELYMQTGDYSKAIKDYTTVINEYPKFLYGYQRRAEAKRKVGDKRGADKDESHVIKETVAHKYGYSTPTSRLKNKTRKKSERNIDDYNKLVEDDNVDNKYESQYRGKIQNKPVEAKLMPRIPEKIKQYNDIISKDINILFYQAYEKAQTGDIGDAIIDLNKAIELNPSFAEAYYNRGLLKLLIDDVSPAIMDLSKAGELGIYSAYNIIKKNQNKKM